MFDELVLTLVVTQDCNLRCHYCYAGEKSRRRMPEAMGDAAIARGVKSLSPGGKLELGFFGGEPMLEAAAVGRWIDQAKRAAGRAGLFCEFHVTTNGTVDQDAAWAVLGRPELRVAVSADGTAGAHDRHRVYADGRGSFERVKKTVERLLPIKGKDLAVVMVVRPDTVGELAAGIKFWHEVGVHRIEPTLDLWTSWTAEDAEALRRAIGAAAEVWASCLPNIAMGWFDDKAVGLSGQVCGKRCRFGEGELTVAPSGRMYPCERLVGNDPPEHPLQLAGNVMDGVADFCAYRAPAAREAAACGECTMGHMCTTYCRCANYVRTGDVRHPDGLLCLWNQACLEEVERRVVPMGVEGGGGKGEG